MISDHESMSDFDGMEVEDSVFDSQDEGNVQYATTAAGSSEPKQTRLVDQTRSDALGDDEPPRMRMSTAVSKSVWKTPTLTTAGVWKVPSGIKNTGLTILEVWMKNPMQVWHFRNMHKRGDLRNDGSWDGLEQACEQAGITQEFIDALDKCNRPLSDAELQRLRELRPATTSIKSVALTPFQSKGKAPTGARGGRFGGSQVSLLCVQCASPALS
jgi:hypothetical protein